MRATRSSPANLSTRPEGTSAQKPSARKAPCPPGLGRQAREARTSWRATTPRRITRVNPRHDRLETGQIGTTQVWFSLRLAKPHTRAANPTKIINQDLGFADSLSWTRFSIPSTARAYGHSAPHASSPTSRDLPQRRLCFRGTLHPETQRWPLPWRRALPRSLPRRSRKTNPEGSER